MGAENRKIPLATKPCEKCGAEAQEVIHAERKIRRGWYCPACRHFDKAIFRETKTDVQ